MPGELRTVEQYLKAMSLVVERQVMLESKIIEVQLSDSHQTGVNWAAFGQGNNSRIAGIALVLLLLLQPSHRISLPPPTKDRVTLIGLDTSLSMKQRDEGDKQTNTKSEGKCDPSACP